MKPCYIGWGDLELNETGRCCCNCKYQFHLMKHPWNTSMFAKGRVSEQFGNVCVCPELYPNATFFDNAHGMCECWSANETSKNDA